jgi:hypothetical protein
MNSPKNTDPNLRPPVSNPAQHRGEFHPWILFDLLLYSIVRNTVDDALRILRRVRDFLWRIGSVPMINMVSVGFRIVIA